MPPKKIAASRASNLRKARKVQASPPLPTLDDLAWRHDGLARVMNVALHNLQSRVIEIMVHAGYPEMRLAYVNLTRNLDIEGTTITELANRAAMTKQAMGELVDQCEKIDIVERTADPKDRRVWIVKFTSRGLIWLNELKNAVTQVETEMIEVIGKPAFRALGDSLRAYNRADLPDIGPEKSND